MAKQRCARIPDGTRLEDKIRILLDEATPDEHGCLISPRSCVGAGYPAQHHNGKMKKICRLILLSQGHDMIGLEARHTCHNRKCINPDHIVFGTHQENMLDCARIFRMSSGKLTSEDQVHEIRRMRGIEKRSVIAKRFGINPSHVSYIQLGKGYKWLPWEEGVSHAQ